MHFVENDVKNNEVIFIACLEDILGFPNKDMVKSDT